MWPDTQRYTVLQTDSGQYKNIHNLFPALGVINRYTDMIDSSDTHAVFTEYRGPIESFITWRSISACSRPQFFKYGCCCKEATTFKKMDASPTEDQHNQDSFKVNTEESDR